MRKLFWVLLLANAALFALMQRGTLDWLGWSGPAVQPQPELNADKIRLLPALQSPPAKPLPAAPASAPAPAHAPVPAPNSPVPAVVPPAPTAKAPPTAAVQNMEASEGDKPGTSICLEWGEFSGSDLTRATAELSAMQLADKVSRRQIERDIGYWVYIPPLKNRAAVNRKLAELKAAGVKEYFVVQTPGHWLNAISLGVFKTRDAAENFLRVVHAEGVRTAKVGERASKLITTVFMLNRVDAGTETKLKAIQKDFAGSELNRVPCGLTR
jgi:hypothetical protein